MATPETSAEYLATFTETFGTKCQNIKPKEFAVLLEQMAYVLMDRAEDSHVSEDVRGAANMIYENLQTSDLLNLMGTLVENAKMHAE